MGLKKKKNVTRRCMSNLWNSSNSEISLICVYVCGCEILIGWTACIVLPGHRQSTAAGVRRVLGGPARKENLRKPGRTEKKKYKVISSDDARSLDGAQGLGIDGQWKSVRGRTSY